ncbi:MAG: NAD(P)H-dependent glycerol-3-phosphate dehydrogenase [Schleiferiaceae bacterium]|jgi:glycerol-3-phosphate dehydrogenase (NAD(P)+)|nr:NAD(P)H-dependent glycerol-3-phosphate dehydrogenase [Flavobacteriia bacterium]NDA07102.1 NAD(P)H-dependent glycerol-3-phosphate dehydrogenase [Flavobacteriia bacterium]NDA27809.1 NAD(P)H-dependent glycerol-3-phosphate dehydrogenase [Flavobacteriia bacterium]
MGKNPSIAVLGSGSWATALVKILSQNNDRVGWWVRSDETILHVQIHHHNPKYLSEVELDVDKLDMDSDIRAVAEEADILVLAIPSAFLAEAIEPIRDLLPSKNVFSAVKGIVPQTHQIVGEYLHDSFGLSYQQFGAVLGPCHAEEVALERLSYLTIASQNDQLARIMAKKVSGPAIQTNCTDDIYGTEYASVLKNIYAIAAGICHGLGYGDNFQAVLVSNALVEMKRFIKAVEPMKRDISRTAYSGDLFVTMYSPFSRNRTLGNLIGKGYTVRSAMLEMSMVAEGYYATKLIRDVKKSREVRMPIASAVYKILYEGKPPKKVVRELAEKLK